MLLAILFSACSKDPPEDPVTACAKGEVLDGSVCVPEACGAGIWGSLPVDVGTVYVSVDAGEGGDGSEGAPLNSIQAGVDLVGDRGGGLVAVAAGTYVEVITMGDDHAGVVLAGRCKDFVTIDGSRGDPDGNDVPVIEVAGARKWPDVQIEGVTVTGGTHAGLWVQAANVTMSRSDVRENTYFGVAAGQADVTLVDVAVVGTAPDGRSGGGWGLYAEIGAVLTLTGCTVGGNTEIGLFAGGVGTTVVLVDSEILGTLPNSGGDYGMGIGVGSGAALSATRCAILGNTDLGALVEDDGTTVVLVDTEISDTVPSPAGAGGVGIDVDNGASLTATGCSFSGNAEVGVSAWNAGTTVDLVDTEISGTTPNANGVYGLGISAQDGAALTATACSIVGNTQIGVYATGSGTSVDLKESEVAETQPASGVGDGEGIQALDGAAIFVTGCTVRGNSEAGVLALGAGTTVVLTDTEVLDTQPNTSGEFGRGISVGEGAALTATGCRVRENTDIGVFAADAGTTVDLVDTEVIDTHPMDVAAEGGETYGHGVEAQVGAEITATGCRVQGNAEVGVLASGAGARLDLVDTEVSDTRPRADGSYGRGVEAQDGAALTATRCTVQGNAEVGVSVFGSGTLADLVDTWVGETAPAADGAGSGIQVQTGAGLTTTGCVVQANSGAGVFVYGAGTTADLVDTAIVDTDPTSDGAAGRGVEVGFGASLTATGCTVQGNTDVGVVAQGEGTTVDLVNTQVLDTARGPNSGLALGVTAQAGALLRLTDTEVYDTEGAAAYVTGDGDIELERVQLSGNHFAGAVVLAGSMTLTSTIIADTLPDAEWGGGFGVYALDAFGPPTLTLRDSTIDAHDYAAVWLDGPGTYDIQGNTLSGSPGLDMGTYALHGNALFAENGVVAWDGTTGLLLAGNTFTGASQIGVFLDGSSAVLDDNSWSGNSTDVRQQRCESSVQLTSDDLLGVPTAAVCPGSNSITAYDLEFTGLYLETMGTAE